MGDFTFWYYLIFGLVAYTLGVVILFLWVYIPIKILFSRLVKREIVTIMLSAILINIYTIVVISYSENYFKEQSEVNGDVFVFLAGVFIVLASVTLYIFCLSLLERVESDGDLKPAVWIQALLFVLINFIVYSLLKNSVLMESRYLSWVSKSVGFQFEKIREFISWISFF